MTKSRRLGTGAATTAMTAAAMKRVNIQLPDELHTRAKIVAVLRGTTLNDYFSDAIKKQVEKDQGVLKKLENR